MKFFLRIILWLTAISLLVALAASLAAGYKTSMSFLVSLMHEQARGEKIFLLIKESKFLFLQVILFAAIIAIVTLFIKFDRTWGVTKKSFSDFRKSIAGVVRDARSGALLILILPTVSYIFFAFYLPVAYDEASTYVNFTSHSPLVSMLYYQSPNNHILNSVITTFTKYIPFLGPLQCMRISSIIASVLTCIVLFAFVKKYYSVNYALVVTGISSVLSLYIYYSFVSRGYALVNLFFVLCMYSVYKIIFENSKTKHWMYFSFFSVLGFYAMPSFLYPFITLQLVLLPDNYRRFLKQLLFGFITFSVVAILYVPIIAVNGLQVLTNNKQLLSVTRQEALNLFPHFAFDSLTEVTGINFWFIGFLLLAALLILAVQKKFLEVKLIAAFILAPPLLMVLNPLIPFARTFTYYCIALPLLCLFPIGTYLEKFAQKYVTVAVVLVQIIFLYSFYLKMKIHKSENMQYAAFNKAIAGNHSYYLNCKWYDAVLSFELKSRNFNGAVLKYNNPPVRVNADTISNYDYIIIDKIYDETKNLTPLFSDKVSNIYKK